jgi:hypothetical protein
MKRIDRFDPVPGKTRAECDRHYLEIHHAFARNMYRSDEADVQLYVANRALGQYDINGGFDQDPTAWRFVFEDVRDGLDGANAFIPEWAKDTIWEDHRRCLANFRGYDVEPETVLDRVSGQLISVKYLFEYHRPEGMEVEEAEAYYADVHLPRLRERLDGAFGVRRAITNRVLRQTAMLDDAGQVISNEYMPSTTAHRYEELWFDNVAWGGEFFRQREIVELMHGSPLTVEGYHVDQRCGVDKS